MMREQFAGWGMYDHEAVCVDCRHHHLIAKAEQVTVQPWLDWVHKHKGHHTFIIPHSLLSDLNLLRGLGGLKHNSDVKAAYAASAAFTATLSSLATDANLVNGRESTWIDNTSNKYIDELVAGKLTTGTTPTAAKQLEVHALGTQNDTPTYPTPFTGTDSAISTLIIEIKNTICRSVATIPTTNTSDKTYPFGPLGMRQLFGDALPSRYGLFVTHNTGVNLNATGTNQALSRTPVYATVI